MISWRHIVPMLFTVSAMLAGVFSILKAAEGSFSLAASLIMLSMILDGLDGNLARLLKSTSSFGAEMDTYVDILSFGIAPALLAYWVGLESFGLLGLVMTCAMILSGMARLSRFRLVDPHRGGKGYLGMPITVNAAWVALTIFLVLETGYFDMDDFQKGPVALAIWGVSMVMIVLQVSHFHYGKPTKSWLFTLPSLGLVLSLFLHKELLGIISATFMALYGIFYAFVSPFLPKPVEFEEVADLEEDEAISY